VYLLVFTLILLGILIVNSYPVAALFKAWVCSRSLAGIVGSNSAGDMDVSVF
jgi:hypothetical protein